MASAALVGSTGLVGSNILSTLLSSAPATKDISAIHAFARRPLPAANDPASRLRPHTSSDPSRWPSDYPGLASPAPQIFLSALGTTRGQAGSLAKQRAVDLDQNLALAKAAAQAGTRTYVLISSGSSSSSSVFPYLRMKGELEDAVSALDFDNVVILRPGLLLGKRADSRPPEYILQTIASILGAISKRWLTDWWAQDVRTIARAAVQSGVLASQGQKPDGVGKVWVVGQSEIIRLGTTEWKE